jgi:excinuclease ABC subunit B
MEKFSMITDFIPAGDQPQAISDLVKGLDKGKTHEKIIIAYVIHSSFCLC